MMEARIIRHFDWYPMPVIIVLFFSDLQRVGIRSVLLNDVVNIFQVVYISLRMPADLDIDITG